MDSSFVSRQHVYQTIPGHIIEATEAGAGQFVVQLHCVGPGRGRPSNAATRMSYRGANVVALWVAAMLSGFRS